MCSASLQPSHDHRHALLHKLCVYLSAHNTVMPSLANPDGKGSGLLPLTGSRQARKSLCFISFTSKPKKKKPLGSIWAGGAVLTGEGVLILCWLISSYLVKGQANGVSFLGTLTRCRERQSNCLKVDEWYINSANQWNLLAQSTSISHTEFN